MSIEAKTLVETHLVEHATRYHKIVGHKRTVGLLATESGIVALGLHPVEVAKVTVGRIALAVVNPSSHHHRRLPVDPRGIAAQEPVANHRIVVEKKQIVTSGILKEEVADSGPANVFLKLDIAAHFFERGIFLSPCG